LMKREWPKFSPANQRKPVFTGSFKKNLQLDKCN
jgi:hypothetical protein